MLKPVENMSVRELREEHLECCWAIGEIAKSAIGANRKGNSEAVHDLLFAITRLAEFQADRMEGV